MKRKIAIKIEYDGTKFYGWQYQPDRKTVQDEIEKALEIIFKQKIIEEFNIKTHIVDYKEEIGL